MNFQVPRKRNRDMLSSDDSCSKRSDKQTLSHLCSWELAEKEHLYFPTRRVRADSPSKLNILKRIETQNFEGLSEDELHRCWQEMARQIKSFKRKLRKVNEWFAEDEESCKPLVPTASRIISVGSSKSAPKDQKDVMSNLVTMINDGRIRPGTFAFDRICSLVRGSMQKEGVGNIKCQSTFSVNLNVNHSSIPVTSVEYENLKPLSSDPNLVSLLAGKSRQFDDIG